MSVKVEVIGRLVRNPEIKNSQRGQQYTHVSVAGNEGHYENQETFYYEADFFGTRGETVQRYQKGDLVSVTGHLNEYQSQSGRTYKSLRYADIELLQRAHTEARQNSSGYQQSTPQQPQGSYQQQEVPQQQGNYQSQSTEQVDLNSLPFKGSSLQSPQKPAAPQKPGIPKTKLDVPF